MSWHEPGKDDYRKNRKPKPIPFTLIMVLIILGATLETVYMKMTIVPDTQPIESVTTDDN